MRILNRIPGGQKNVYCKLTVGSYCTKYSKRKVIKRDVKNEASFPPLAFSYRVAISINQ
jgi:hypothetical protein